MSAVITVNINDMTEREFAQAWDLLNLNSIMATQQSNPINSTRSIAIEVKDNQHAANALDGTLGYINQHIIDQPN